MQAKGFVLATKNFLAVISLVELMERFAYYGLTSLLIISLTTGLCLSDAQAYAISGVFSSVGFAVPIVGGMLADKVLSIKHLIPVGAILSLVGYTLTAIFHYNETVFVYGLAFIAVGTGIFKGNLTILLGNCYSEKDPQRDHGFTIFYVCINFGILLSSLACGYASKHFGISSGLVINALGMLGSLLVLLHYKNTLNFAYQNSQKDNQTKIGTAFLTIILLSLLIVSTTYALNNAQKSAKILSCIAGLLMLHFCYVTLKSSSKERAKLLVLMFIIPFLTVFYALQSQLYFSINLFIKRNLASDVLGHAVPSTALQSIAPVAAILFGAYISSVMSKSGRKPSQGNGFIRFGIGLCGPMMCFLMLYVGCARAVDGKVNFLYALSLGLIGGAESLIGPFAYNKATLLAPKAMQGYAMSIVFTAIAVGNLSCAIAARFISVKTDQTDLLSSIQIYKKVFAYTGLMEMAICIIFFCLYYALRKKIEKACS